MSYVALSEQLKRELNRRARPDFRALRGFLKPARLTKDQRIVYTEPSHFDKVVGDIATLTLVGKDSDSFLVIELQYAIRKRGSKYVFDDMAAARIRIGEEKSINIMLRHVNEYCSRIISKF